MQKLDLWLVRDINRLAIHSCVFLPSFAEKIFDMIKPERNAGARKSEVAMTIPLDDQTKVNNA